MGNLEKPREGPERETTELRSQLAEARETLRAIREGEVDALVISTPQGQRTFTLQSADQSYQTIVEQMQEGAVTLFEDGRISYSNRRFAEMVHRPLEQIIGSYVHQYVVESDRDCLGQLIGQALGGNARGELTLRAGGVSQVPVHISLSVMTLNAISSICMVVTDLTERKKAEDLLRTANAYNRTLIEASLDPMVAIGPNGRITDVNTAAENLTGHPRAELLGADFSSCFTEPDKARASLENVFQDGFVQEQPLDLRLCDGRIIPVLCNASVYRDEAGQVAGVLVAIRDATQYQKAKEGLREIETKFRILYESSTDAIMTLTSAGKFLGGNPAAIKMFRCKDEADFASRTPASLSPEHQPDDLPSSGKAQRMIGLAMEHGSHFFEWRHRRSDGEDFDASVLLTRIELNGECILQATVRDITQSKKAEERQLRLLQRQAGMNQLQKDLLLPESFEQKCKRITEAAVKLLDVDFCRLWCLQPGDLCNSGCIHASATDTEQPCRHRDNCLHLIASSGRYTHTDGNHRRVPMGCYKIGRIASDEEEHFLTNDVTTDPRVHDHAWTKRLGLVSFAGYKLHDGEDKPMGVLAVFAKRPLLEEDDAFLSGLAETSSRVFMFDRAAERLMDAQTQAIANSEAKSAFLANMSHEIRTPLNGILGMEQLLMGTAITAEQREYVEAIKVSGESLLEVINEVLDFSRIETGKMELEIVEFDVRTRLANSVETVAVRAEEKGLELVSHVCDDVPANLLGDPLRLQQIVVNLLGNAIKFTERGEVSLEVAVESKEEDTCVLHFSIVDTGIGIAAEKQELVFAAFMQSDNSFTRKFGGTGLGLAIARELVQKMGGKIWLESELGRGSTFHFTARFAIGKPSSKIAPASLLAMPVMVVEHNTKRRLAILEMLTSWRMKPTAVDSGQAALDALAQASAAGHSFGLILLDVRVPDIDGFVLAERIKRDPNLTTAVITLLPWRGRTENDVRCRALGIDAHVTIPLRPSALLDVITNVVATRDAWNVRAKEATPLDLEAAHAATETALRAPTARILLAEDNPINQLFAARLLEKRGYEVVVASDGKEAVALLGAQKFDLVLMDVQMPEMDGIEATAAIRQAEAVTGGHVPIVAMTAHALKGDSDRCLAGGMDSYIGKPIHAKDLYCVVEQTLANLA